MLANIFGTSPVMPLEKHVGLAYKCTRQLVPFFEAVIDDDWETAASLRVEIEKLEHVKGRDRKAGT